MTDAAEESKDKSRRQTAVAKRRDHQPLEAGALPEETCRTHLALGHETKVFKYRDQIFQILAKTAMEPSIFERLDTQSLKDLRGRAKNSQIALMSDFLGYVRHIQTISGAQEPMVCSFPITERTLGLYLDALETEGNKFSTIKRHLNTLRTWQSWAGLEDPTKGLEIQQRLRGFKNSRANRIEQKDGLLMGHLKRAVEAHNPDVPRDIADLALLFTAYETMCRRSELVKFTWENLSIDDQDGSGLLHLETSKTDQTFEGKDIYLSPVTVDLLRYWQARCGKTTGSIFRCIYSDGTLGRRLSEKSVAGAFKRIARKIGESDLDIGAHSTRIGAAIDQLEHSIELAEIMQSGRWKSAAMVIRYTQKSRAKRSGMAKMLQDELGWTPEAVLSSGRRQLIRR